MLRLKTVKTKAFLLYELMSLNDTLLSGIGAQTKPMVALAYRTWRANLLPSLSFFYTRCERGAAWINVSCSRLRCSCMKCKYGITCELCLMRDETCEHMKRRVGRRYSMTGMVLGVIHRSWRVPIIIHPQFPSSQNIIGELHQ